MSKIKKVLSDSKELVKLGFQYRREKQELERLNRIMAAENKLTAIAGTEFLQAIKPTISKLSEETARTYESYIDEAIEMLKDGKSKLSVIYEFDKRVKQ